MKREANVSSSDCNPASQMKLTVDLQVRPLESLVLGIGVGGKIEQSIIPDMSDPRIWDVGNAKLLNIGIVSSSDFKAITGHEAPQPPVTTEPLNDDCGFAGVAGPGKGISQKVVSASRIFDTLEAAQEADSKGKSRVSLEIESGITSSSSDSKLPGLPVVMAEPDQTIPWFQGRAVLEALESGSKTKRLWDSAR